MTSEYIRQRSDLLGTQVITRDSGRRLGVVSQVWVDVDRREVVALGMRSNLLAVSGIPKFMPLENIRQIGDVILVEDDTAIEDDWEIDAYSTLTGSEVITETGELLGKVRGFKFDARDGSLVSVIIASIGLPQIPEQILSTYELPIEEVVSSGPERLIVFEGAEERLTQLSVGVMERLGLGAAPWDRENEEEFYPPSARPENQLGSGLPVRDERRRPVQSPIESRWEEDEYDRPAPEPEPVYVEYDRPVNQAQQATYNEPTYEAPYREEAPYESLEDDAWSDQEDTRYRAPKVNIPQKEREPEYQPEYQEEAEY
ncbi:MAG: photosystem reaction center subunit H [Coleofasciculaceae cyanobacterium RL_1_1]|nr:photosystem reaction center subunit H [Coleofasciculaceae cyanobacterium RL_1_1]